MVSKVYKNAYGYQVFQPTYSSGHYSFLFASDAVHPFKTPIDWKAFEAKNISTGYYTPELHVGSFALPQRVTDRVQGDARLRLSDISHQTLQH